MKNGTAKLLFFLCMVPVWLPAQLPDGVLSCAVSAVNAGTPGEKEAIVSEKNTRIVTGFQGIPARVIGRDGSITYRLAAADPAVPQLLVIQHSSNDPVPKGEKRLIRILVNGKFLNNDSFIWNEKDRLYEVYYPICKEFLAEGSRELTVTLSSFDKEHVSGEIYSVGIVRKKTVPDGFDDMANYSGITPDRHVDRSGVVTFTVPDAPKTGPVRSDVLNLHKYFGLKLIVENKSRAASRFRIDLVSSEWEVDVRNAEFDLTPGLNTVVIPGRLFRSPEGYISQLYNIRKVIFRFQPGCEIRWNSLALMEGESVFVETPVNSRAMEGDRTAEYTISVKNCEAVSQTVRFALQADGWEAMRSRIEPAELKLTPGASGSVTLKVTVPAKLPPGAKEIQKVNIIPSADPAAARQEWFITVRRLPHPYAIHTREGWDEVRKKCETVKWAGEARAEILKNADLWNAPGVTQFMQTPDGLRCVSVTGQSEKCFNAALAWQLSRDRKYAAKVKQFLLSWSDPLLGYPFTRFGCHQGPPQEGGYTYNLAWAYDMIVDSGLLSEAEQTQIERSFRLFAEGLLDQGGAPTGANWTVSMQTGAFFAALAIQDLDLVDRLLFAPSMLMDKFRTYTMSDGWWYECTISYNLWCSSMLCDKKLLENFV